MNHLRQHDLGREVLGLLEGIGGDPNKTARTQTGKAGVYPGGDEAQKAGQSAADESREDGKERSRKR